jgi:RimJ/RimL family protein N-acetyltransferase
VKDKMTNIKSYQTQRLIIKQVDKTDASFLLELMNTPKWHKYIGDRNVYNIDDAIAYISEKMTPQFDRLGFGNFIVIRKLDGLKIGSCGLYDREGLEGVDIGFGFLPKFEKQGYAFESALKMKDLAIKEFGLKTINAITNKDNIPSQKLLEKLGLSYIKPIKLPNSDEEIMFYQIEIS